MLSQYTSKFIQLLSKEIQLYKWAKLNYPEGYDLESLLKDAINSDEYLHLCSAKNLMFSFENEPYSSDFGEAMINSSYYNYNNLFFEWVKSFSKREDQEKACLFLAKTVNRFVLLKENSRINEVNKNYQFNDFAVGFVSDYDSLPLKETFLKTTSANSFKIQKNDIRSFASFDENASFYSKHTRDWATAINKEEFLKWFIMPKENGEVSIQVTPYSYTQVGNPEIEEGSVSGVELTQNLIYFKYGEPIATADDAEAFRNEIEPLEKYALEIQSISKYSIIDMKIDAMLDRLQTAANISSTLTRRGEIPKSSLSYKLVFDILEQESVVVPSVDMFQAVLYLRSMGSETISLFYDAVKKRVVIKGKDFESEVTYTEKIPIKGSRFFDTKTVTNKITIPTFSIIYEQPIDELTAFTPIEYVEFFNPTLTFRKKYDLLNSKREAPIELPKEFVEEYPDVAASYEQQINVGLSTKSEEEKYDYVQRLITEYLNSYTEIVDGKRQSLVSPDWEDGDYVLKVNEAYWNYNSQIEVEELLAFFVSKGNDLGYRMLSLKILGVDYQLFSQPITISLLQSNDIYVSKLEVDEANITADIVYETKNAFISGNIYDKKEHIVRSGDDDFSYSKNLNIFFEDLSSNIYEKALTTIDDAIESRFTPALVPLVKDPKEVKALELNIDISCPIFFKGKAQASNSRTIPNQLITTLLNTGSSVNHINMKYGHYESKQLKYGHYELFNQWLNANSAQILGNYTYSEIRDCYIYPYGQDDYIYKYVFPLFKDANKNIVGFSTIAGDYGKLIKNIENANGTTMLILKELGYIANSTHVTRQEAEEIKKKFVLLYKARYWAARREGRRLFNEFLRKAIDNISRQQIDQLWNKEYNNYAKPELVKVPMFPSHSYKFGKRSESNRFNLMEAQKEGIRHVLSRENSGLFLHEVGFGKTTSSITAVSSMMNTGEASRVLFLVPNSVYDKFQDEIKGNESVHGLLPNANIVLLDNLTEKVITNQKPEKQIKVFTSEELETINNFKKFDRQFNKIISGLKRGKITFPNDPLYVSTSNWETAYDLIKKELKLYVALWDKLEVLNLHIEHLKDIYNDAEEEFDSFYREQQEIIDNPETSDAKQKSAAKDIKITAEKLSNKLTRSLKSYVQFVAVSLVDDLGVYTEKTMSEKTILIAKHSAVESKLRPDKNAVLRALMFKEGLGEPSREVKTLNLSEWADITGLTEGKCKVAVKVLSKHPISLERLNIDAVVIDEIHNFNNIVNRAGTKGWEHSGSNTYVSDTSMTRKNRRNTEYFSLEKYSGGTKNRFAMKYDSTGRASDQKGSKLTAAAVCFDIQYRSKKRNNVLLLSATPFTDTPFQVVSVLGMANYNMLQENGIESAWDFFNNYVDEIYKYDLRHDGAYGLFIDVNGYYNDKALSNLITNVSNVKITDEKIEASRPKKAIIPANKMSSKSDGEDAIDATNNMGDVFEELSNVNSRIELSENQEKFQEIIRAYITDDNDQRPIKDIFPINEDRITKLKADVLAEEIQELVDDKIEEANSDPDNADFVVNFLQGLYDKGRYAQHPTLKDAIDHITVKILKGSIDKPDEDELEAVAADTSQMSAVQKLAGKAIGVQQAQQALVISPYFVNLGDDSYTSTFLPDLEPDPATIFVEQSPKLMFVVESIKQTLEYQKGQLERGEIDRIGGQVIYFDKHNFGYGGKRYNAFSLLAEYIAKNVEGVSADKNANGNYVEIATIDGSTRIEDSIAKGSGETVRGRTSIKDSFNNGEIKVLIGSKAIKEGIDLQGNAHTMYICEAEFSPEVAMQLEGRIWRQKNPYDVVRVVYVLAMNTIDSFVYSKINRKVNMIKRMLELGVYEMNTTQFVIDTKEMLIQLESDPDKLTEIQYQDEITYLTDYISTIDKKIQRLRAVKNNYEDVAAQWEVKFPQLNKLYGLLSEARETYYKNSEVKKEIKKEKSLQKIQDYEASGYKKPIDEWQKDKKSSFDASKYDISQKEIDERYLAKITKNPKLNPLPKLKVPISIDTQYSEIEKIVIRVNKALLVSENIENTWRRATEEEQQIIRDKENKSAGELNWIAFYDTTESFDLAGYMRGLRTTFIDNIANINIIETYQSNIKNEGKTLDDIDSVISEFESEYNEGAAKIGDELGFKAELRKQWVKALAERTETSDGSISGLVKTMSDSLPLIRLRTKEQKESMLSAADAKIIKS